MAHHYELDEVWNAYIGKYMKGCMAHHYELDEVWNAYIG